jgi:hypothetical protein
MATTDFEIVDRPRGGGSVPDVLIDALVKTLDSSKAVRVRMDDHGHFTTWQANVRARLRTDHQLRLRTKFNKSQKMVTAWVERFDDRTATDLSDEDLGVSEDNA